MKLADLATPFRVGLLVIAGIVATMYMFTQVSSKPEGDEGVEVYVMLDNASGLAEQSFIAMAGIQVGRIQKISLADGRARVDLSVRGDIPIYQGVLGEDGVWRNGATVQAKQVSFIGDYFLELTPGIDGKRLEDGDEIKIVVSSTSVDEIMAKMNDIATDISKVTNSLAEVFGSDEGKESLKELLVNLQVMVESLNQFVGENTPKLDRILSNVDNIAADFEDLSGPSTEAVENILRDTEAIVQEVRFIVGQSSTDLQSGLGTLKGTLSRLQATLDSLNYSLQNVQDITDKINEGEGTLGELVNNPAIAQRTEEILTDAGDLLGRVTKLKTIIELRTEYHARNSQFKNIIGLRLKPNEDKYYLIELVDDYRGFTEIYTTDVNTTNADDPDAQFRETRVETTDRFKVSLLYGQAFEINPWLAIGGRFGLIESTGGVGAELFLLPDRALMVQADVFSFSYDINPRVRTTATLDFLTHFYIAAGVDDILNDRTEYFFGGGLRFDDEDLKAILTTTGVPSP